MSASTGHRSGPDAAELFRQVLNHADNAILVLDDEGRVVRYNERYVELWGFDRAFLDGRPHIEDCIRLACRIGLYPPEREAELVANRREHLRRRTPRTELETPRLDGVTVEGYLAPLPDGGHLLSFRDVTERERARRALEESEVRHRTIMEAMEELVYSSSPDYRLEYLNPAMVRRIGRDATGEICHRALHGLDAPCPGCAHAAVVGTRQSHLWEATSPLDGRTYHVSGAPLVHADGSVSKLAVIRDITNRKHMEERLRQQAAFSAHLLQDSAVATFVIDPEHRLLLWNRACEQLTGLAAADMLGTDHHWRAFYPHRRPCLADLIVDGEREPGPELYPVWGRADLVRDGLHGEGWFDDLGGKRRYLVFDAAPLRDADGILVGAVETLQDITERKRAEEAAEASLSLLASILESTEDGILVVDRDGRVVRHNERFAQLWGMPREVLAPCDGARALEWTRIRVADPDAFLRRVRQFHRQPEAEGFDVVRLRDGRVFERFTTPQRVDGKPRGRVWSFRDVTARNRAQAERAQLARAVEQAAEAVVITDTRGVVQYVNPSFQRIWGRSTAESLGRSLLTLIASSTAAAAIREALNRGEVWAGRIRLDGAEGMTREAECSLSPLFDEEGRRVNWVALLQDVTREVDLERQVALSQKLQAIGTLAGGIAHDFNNLLTVILGSTELALDEVPPGSRAALSLDRVLHAGERARDLVGQILAFSRQESEGKKPVHLQPLVEETLDFLRVSVPSTVEIRRDLRAPEAVVLADSSQITQVLLNLCTNAVQALDEGHGILEVALEADAASGARNGDRATSGPNVSIRVSDDGHGIPEELLPRIFDPFYTTKEVGTGTGLGLSVVHGIVENHGGTVQVTSRPGGGTTFHVVLPRLEELPSPPELREEERPGRGRGRILFVDDEELLADLGGHLLGSLGYETVTCRDGTEALDAFRADPDGFDLVLTDQMMPGLKGDALARQIHALRPELPILLCTGFSASLHPDRVAEAGIRELIPKPIRRSEIAAAIGRALAAPDRPTVDKETDHGVHPGG